MKIKIDVDCTPEEARVFMGLPDVKPMQDALMDQMQQRLETAMKAMDPETVLRQWFTGNGWEQMQKFWTLSGAGGDKAK